MKLEATKISDGAKMFGFRPILSLFGQKIDLKLIQMGT